VLYAVGDTSHRFSPGDFLLLPAVRRTIYLAGDVDETHLDAKDRKITPLSWFIQSIYDLASASANRTTAAILVWPYHHIKLPVMILELKIQNFQN
jgi:hypothetical protein